MISSQKLKPDFVCSVTNLSEVLKSKYDVVLCAQVLEHLPFSEFEKSLNEIKKVWSVKIPFPRKHKFDGEKSITGKLERKAIR